MGSMTNIADYFKGKDVPKVHPFQEVPRDNTFFGNKDAMSGEGEQPFGYDGKKHISTNKSHKSLKTKK